MEFLTNDYNNLEQKMFEPEKFIQNSFAIAFPRCPDIRRMANDFEDLLKEKFKDHYGQPQVISLPDELDPEMPRLIFGSLHGFSQIIVTQIGMTLNVAYSPDWQADISKGKIYMLERTQVLFCLHEILKTIPIYFSGFITRVRIQTSLGEKDLIEHLKNFFSTNPTKGELYDINVKHTEVIKGRFFNNISIQNYRSGEISNKSQSVPRFATNKATERGMEILGDFNDRYMFNKKEEYISDSKIAGQIIDEGYYQIENTIKEIRGKQK